MTTDHPPVDVDHVDCRPTDTLALLKLLALGCDEIAAGRTIDARKAIKRLAAARG